MVICRDTGMCESVIWIQCDSLLITDDSPGEAIFGKGIPVKATTQICLMRLWIIGSAFGQAKTFVNRQMRDDCFRDVGRDNVFETQDIGKLFVKLSGPGSSFISNA